MLKAILWPACVALLVSAGLVFATRNWARRRMLLDRPNPRSLHVQPTPRGGGIGIVVPTCVALGAMGAIAPGYQITAAWIAGIGLLIAAVGMVDDLRGLSAFPRLVVQGSAAVLMVAGIGTWRTLVWPGVLHVDLGWMAVPFTILLVVGLTNAYNFMDGIDGIAGVQGTIAGIGWIVAGYALQDPMLPVTGAVIAAASVGFLLFNWPPASVFMGDVGSGFLGFVLAALSVSVALRSPATATAGILFLWPFVFDTAFTLLRRVRRRENLLHAHRSHLYQRLVLTGLSHRSVTMMYGVLAIAGVVVGRVVAREAATGSSAGALLIATLSGALWLSVVWRERTTHVTGRPHRQVDIA
jgi:UDP-N-acetylmuramyl pentapeptide phosphotransferase/UDP-N-acetylglucosamine-1-phosphate transferase